MEGPSSDDFLIPDHKLCGFLCVALSPGFPDEICQKSDTLEDICFGSRCHIFRSGSVVAFRASNGVVFSPLDSNKTIECDTPDTNAKTMGKIDKTKKKAISVENVCGGASLLHSLHVLVSQKCFRIVSTVAGVASEENGDSRAVILIDVHLPFALWSGWQFPKSRSAAAKLFRHLSCDWQQRSLMLFSKEQCHGYLHAHAQSIWNLSYCHVIGCKLKCGASGSSNKKLFDLHEIFNSVAGIVRKKNPDSSRVKKDVLSSCCGISELSDDVLSYILSALGPIDLVRVAATCRHLRSVALPIMPCIKLKLFPHQQIAAGWMLQREKNAEVIPHPLYSCFLTEDGFSFYIHSVSGEIVTGIAPVINDFHGGMFCDEPGLGKTITALSLILKTQGRVAEPPNGAQVTWCTHNANYKCGYYELSGHKINGIKMSLGKRLTGKIPVGGHFCSNDSTPSSTKRARTMISDSYSCIESTSCSMSTPRVARSIKGLSHIKRNLFNSFQDAKSKKIRHGSKFTGHLCMDLQLKKRNGVSHYNKKLGRDDVDHIKPNDLWVQCDSCQKWRKLENTDVTDSSAAWFCSMNTDPSFQSCSVPEETWDYGEIVTYFPGFYTKGTSGANDQNVSLFTNVLKEHYALMNVETKQALIWLTKLSSEKLSEMETVGLICPAYDTSISSIGVQGFHKIFEAFGLTKRVIKGVSRWFYPKTLNNLVFDLPALRIAIHEPLDSVRLYLSGATLIVVPSNLVDHWITQIEKHIKPGQLRVYFWTDHKKPSPHCLAWDYDIVITTFSRLSAEWGPHKRSPLLQVHWLRVMLDEGHTLGSSLAVTNKLQMAISLTSSNRWILTGTPTPNMPNNQLSHLHPMLKFLHEEAYGNNQKSWQLGILKPFEAEIDEGRSRLIDLLFRCMIIARKIDLHTIPPCIKKATYLDFTEEHARSYNELVVTVQRNILMADWNDPSHVESLLNPKQWKFRGSTIRNVRLSCCVAGHIKVTDAGQDIQETMDILVENGLDPESEEHDDIKYNLLFGGKCMRCTEWCRLPVITPCRHLLCLVCIALNNEKCTFPGCGNLYEMQSPEILTRPENPNPKWPVPKDLIELQPSYKQDDWDPDWQSTSSSKVAYLVRCLKALQDLDDEIGSQHSPSHGCKPYMKKISKDKVLIFSQFLEHIHVIEQQLTIVDVKFVGMYSPMHSAKKIESLSVFQHDSNCVALLMDGSAALGLDLSFVTHVFLMEPIWDRSMEEQVISRAHRMGAMRPVHVETLAMRGTIEEQMLEFLQDTDERRKLLKQDFVKPAHGGARVCRTLHDFAESNYLARLTFVRTTSPT